jgi:hypothetical protein
VISLPGGTQRKALGSAKAAVVIGRWDASVFQEVETRHVRVATSNLRHGVFDGEAVVDVAGGDKLKVD